MGMKNTLRDLHRWCSAAPPGTSMDTAALAERLAKILDGDPEPDERPVQVVQAEPSWQVLLWQVTPETRLYPDDVAEAFDKSRSWVYKRTGPKANPRLPHRKLDGGLVFTAGELRAWVRDNEESVCEGESWTPGARPRLEAA